MCVCVFVFVCVCVCVCVCVFVCVRTHAPNAQLLERVAAFEGGGNGEVFWKVAAIVFGGDCVGSVSRWLNGVCRQMGEWGL